MGELRRKQIRGDRPMNRWPRKLRLALLMLGAALGLGGCAGGAFKTPNWLHPGSAEEQRREYQRFDPYPNNQVAPEVVGGRPRDFTNPVAEPQSPRLNAPTARP
jgi:hypothetical protein